MNITNTFINDTLHVTHIFSLFWIKNPDVHCNNKPKLTCHFRIKRISNGLSTNKTKLQRKYSFQLSKRRSHITYSIWHSLMKWEISRNLPCCFLTKLCKASTSDFFVTLVRSLRSRSPLLGFCLLIFYLQQIDENAG